MAQDPAILGSTSGAGLTGPGAGTGRGASAPLDLRAQVRRVLGNPVMGFAPWIVFSVVEGPQRFDWAAAAALGLSLLILVVGLAVGVSGKILDLAAIGFFAVMLVIGLVADSSTHAWLDRWAGEISNVMIAVVALGTVAARRPFTLQYAKEQTEREYWDTPLFKHVNYVLTWVWIGAFFITAAAGWYGDGPLHQPDNVWTNWIISIALLIFAIRFTEWYPDRTRFRALREAGIEDGTDPGSVTVAALFLPLAAYLVPVGVLFLVFDSKPWWIGVSLIIIGSVVSQHLHQAEDGGADPAGR